MLSKNLTLNHTTIENTAGIGLLGINVMKSATVESSVFSHNTSPETCHDPFEMIYSSTVKENVPAIIGGGAYFLYFSSSQKSLQNTDTILSIKDTMFDSNRDCGVTGWIELFIDFVPFLQSMGYLVGAGGGLSLMLAQQNFGVSVDIQRTVFRKNMAPFGAGAHIGLFNGINNSTITFIGCIFDSNGLLGLADDNTKSGEKGTKGGGGLMVFTDLKKNEGYIDPEPRANKNTSLRIIDSTFCNNSAFEGGGTFIYSLYHASKSVTTKDVVRVSFHNCTFCCNQGALGSALEVYEKSFWTRWRN